MDGKKQWWWVLPLFILVLPKIIWSMLKPSPKPSVLSRWDDTPTTAEEDEEAEWLLQRQLRAKQSLEEH